ncbi:uridine kinase [Candidatus Bandiella euplotis]|uniref:Uridine kinase n=1 Tax=Candidatus Bandiella euplotis TaxID=1664265 RepID=A0ABZ0UNB8_9RICK|nr:uridine kinase [Candidatus Bandiella woodruffii]WPX96193.1 Uridine kinase [Candidatus Bandiella woodruffii]
MAKSIIIAVSGPSGSGKSLFSKSICNSFNTDEAEIISEDGYYKHRPELSFEERSVQNYDHPDAFEHELLTIHLSKLKSGKSIEVPLYDYVSHLRKNQTLLVSSCPVIVLEGILLLADEKLRNLIDIKIYMDAPLDICLSRRIYRDSVERGRDIASVITQYNNHVRPMYFKFVEPSRKYADIIVPKGGKNKVAIEVIQAKIGELIQNKK